MISLKKTFSKPRHPWEKQRILEEKNLINSYGFKNKKEIWKVKSDLKQIREQAKRLVSIKTKQDELEKNQLINRLTNYGLIGKEAKIEDVLGLSVNDLCERRLQTIILKRKLANTPKQARQLVVHGHVFVGDKKVKSPSKLVSLKEEPLVKVFKIKIDEKTKVKKKEDKPVEKPKTFKRGKK